MLRMLTLLVALQCSQNPSAPAQDAWLAGRGARSPQRIAAGQARMLTRAFDLTDPQREWLRQEMDHRAELALQHDIATAELIKNVQERIRNGAIKPGESARLIREQNDKDPLKLETVVAALEPQLTPEQRTKGAVKLKELVERSKNRMIADDVKRKAGKAELTRAGAGAGAIEPQMPSEKPVKQMPALHGKAGERPAVPPVAPRGLSGGSTTGSTTGSRTGSTAGATTGANGGKGAAPGGSSAAGGGTSGVGNGVGASALRLPAPPRGSAALTDWQKLVKDLSARYQFTDDQSRTAQAIYTDMEKRADAYRAVHADEYARISLVKDAKDAAARRATIDQPLSAMEQELRERLESIPTAAQRAAATPAAKPRR